MPKVLFHDGLGQYADVTDMGRRWTAVGGSLVAGPRAGCKYNDNGNCRMAVNPSTNTQGVVGVRTLADVLSGGSNSVILSILEADGTTHLTVANANDGSIRVLRGFILTGTLIGQSAAGVINTSNPFFVELKFTIHDSAGEVEVRVNEVPVITLTGVDTRNAGATGTWSQAQFGSNDHKFTDVYIADATGGHDYLGECQTDFHQVTGAGNSAQWTPSAGSNHQNVDDVPSNGDTDYNHTTTTGQKDTFPVDALKHSGAAIVAVTPVVDCKKLDAGTCLVATVVRSGGGETDSADLAPSAAGYRYLSAAPLETNPQTGVAWTEAGFNAAEFGYKKTA